MERHPEKKLNRDVQTMELKIEEGRGFAETVASNTKISSTDKDKTNACFRQDNILRNV